jgi:outer membrane protein
MKRTAFLAVLTLGALLSAPVLAGQPTLTLAQARASALGRSTTLRKAHLAVDSALLAEKTQGYDFLPSISAVVGAGVSYPGSSFADALKGTAGLSVTQAIYDGGKSSLLSAIDSIETKIAREEARAEYFGILEAVDISFHGLLRSQAAVEAAQADLDAARTHLALAQAKLEVHMITQYAYQGTEATAAARETALIQALGGLSVAEATLASLTGLATPFTLQDIDFAGQEQMLAKGAALTGESTATLISAVQKAAGANNPSLSQATLASQKATKAIELATVGYFPSVSAGFSHSMTVGTAQGLSLGSGSVSISATIPLDLWTTKASVDAKTISAKLAGLDEEESRRNFALKVRSVVYDCISSARSAVSSKKALEYAEGNYQGVLERYKLSAASSTDLSDAEALVSSSRTALISARYSFLDNFSSLRTLAGLETGEMLAALIP